MGSLIRDLLKYSQLGGRQMKPKLVDCNAVAKQAVAAIKGTIEETHAAVLIDLLPVVRGDASQLGLVFQNLLANALKFRGKDAPRIHISATKGSREWIFSVRDNGIGMEPQYLQRIFEIYQRLHTQDEYPGTGIGLAICKRVLEGHGGRIWAESVPEKGSTFYFSLPMSPP
jgi:light-regulated signal transduction histidine kinase (bacteriophytochrome)